MPDLHYCFFSVGSWEGNASQVRLRELGAELLKRGVRVSFLLDDVPYNRDEVKLPDGAEPVFVSPARGWRQFGARRVALRRIRPDFLHVLNPSPKAYVTLRLLPSQPLVVDFDEWREHLKWALWRKWSQVILDRWHRRQARALFVASRYMQRGFQELYHLHPVYLPYAAYLQPRPDLPSPFARPTAVYMGNLYDLYDHDLILHAAALLKQRGGIDGVPSMEILGMGPELERWRQYARDQELADRVILRGYVTGDDLWARLRHAHVLLFPIRPTVNNLSRCPSKTYAYAQARRPVITCRVGEIPQVLGDRATYVEPTVEAFADAITAAMARPQPDVDYQIEQHNWGARADTLLEALRGATGGTARGYRNFSPKSDNASK
jgi:glycosyltransferase involved in cell wall biosynthesis